MSMRTVVRWVLVAIAVVGLAIDAYTHFKTADNYDGNTTGTVNQGVLFRIEASVAIIAAVALIVRANMLTAAFALLVAGGGLALLLLYRYVAVGKIGPIPDMTEMLWYGQKTSSAVGEAIAVVASAALLGFFRRNGTRATAS
jgi:hypothetical protein